MVILESMLVLHDKSPALFVFHLQEHCAKDWLVSVESLGRDLPDGLDNVSIDIDTRSTYLGQYLPCCVEIRNPRGRQ